MAVTIDIITTSGLTSLWVALGFNGAFFLWSLFKLYSKGVSNKTPPSLATFAYAAGSVAYLVMAIGDSEMQVSRTTGGSSSTTDYRGFLWLRHAYWALVGGVQLYVLGMFAAAARTEVLFGCAFHVLAVATGFAAVASSGARAAWPLFAVAIALSLPLWTVLTRGYTGAAAIAGPTKAHFLCVKAVLCIMILASIYVIVFGIGTVGKRMGPNAECVAFSVLDILAATAFGGFMNARLVVDVFNSRTGVLPVLGAHALAAAGHAKAAATVTLSVQAGAAVASSKTTSVAGASPAALPSTAALVHTAPVGGAAGSAVPVVPAAADSSSASSTGAA